MKKFTSSDLVIATTIKQMHEGFVVHEIITDGLGKPIDYRFLELNDSYLNMICKTKDDLIGKTVLQVFPDTESYWIEKYGDVALHGGSIEFSSYSKALGKWFSTSAFQIEENIFGVIVRDITKQREQERRIEQNEKRLNSLIRILEYPSKDEQDLLNAALNEAVQITGSEYGYIFTYDDKSEQLKISTWSENVLENCKVIEKRDAYQLCETGLWGEVIRQNRRLIDNNFQSQSSMKKGLPLGHISIQKYLTIPLFISDKIIAVVGVANKKDDYTDDDAVQLELLLTPVFSKVLHIRSLDTIQRKDSLINGVLNAFDDNALFFVDSKGLIRTLSPTNQPTFLFGYNVEERSVISILKDMKTEENFIYFERALKGERQCYKWQLLDESDGRIRYYQTSLTPVVLGEEITGIICTISNITDITDSLNMMATLNK